MDTKKRSAGDEARRFLTNRMRTVSEVRSHLKEKGYSGDEIEETVSLLIGFRYLDDLVYADRYFEWGFDRQRGSERLKRELLNRGVERSVIEEAYSAFVERNSVDESEKAVSLAIELSENYPEFGEKEQAKIARKLMNLGYKAGDVYRALAEARRAAKERTDDEDLRDS